MRRRSLRTGDKKENVQNILFKKSSTRTTIIPESPLVTSIACCSEKISVLETPDTVSRNYGLHRILEAEEAADCNSSEDFVETPNVLRNRKKINLLEKHSGGCGNPSGKITKSRKTISPSKIIFPFDVNDNDEIIRKLNNSEVLCSPRNKRVNTINGASPVFRRSLHQSSLNRSSTIIKDKISKALDSLNLSNQSAPRNLNGSLLGKENATNSPYLQLEKSPQFDINLGASDMHHSVQDTQPSSSLILDGIVAYVDVRSGNDNRSAAIKEFAKSIGAEIANKFTSMVTHLIFKEGSKTTFDRGIQRGVHMVSTLWLDTCYNEGIRVPECQYPALSSNSKTTILPVKYRKPRSMQPVTFEEQEEMATARLRKRLKSHKCSSASEESTSATPIRVQELQHISTKQAMKDFLSPKYGRLSSSSAENWTESDEEMTTPLGDRMYQRMYKERVSQSPLTNEDCEIEKRKLGPNHITNVNKEQNTKVMKSTNKNCDNITSEVTVNTSRRRSRRIEELAEVRCNMSELFSIRNLRLSTSPVMSARKNSTTFNNSNMDITTGESVIIENEYINTQDILNNTRDKSVSIDTNRRLSKCLQEEGSSQMNRSINYRKHRLHTVDIDVPTDDLIVPNTPDSPDKIPSSFYDSLIDLKSQRPGNLVKNGPKTHLEKLKRRKARDKLSDAVSQESSNITGQVTTSDSTMETTDQKMEISELATASANALSPTDNCRPRKLSILPTNRNSIDEFLPGNGNTRHSCVPKETRQSSSICFTSVKSCDLPNLMAIVHKLKGYRTVKSVNASTTHVICGSERRTLNVLRGIIKGCWIVDVSWLFESLDLEKWAPEEPFELFNFCPGAKVSRIAKLDDLPNEKGLLCDIGSICISGSTDPPSADLKIILKNLGATVTPTTQHANIIIGKISNRNHSATYVHEKWLLDCIQHWKIFSPDKYKRQD